MRLSKSLGDSFSKDLACILLLILFAVAFFWQLLFTGKVFARDDIPSMFLPYRQYAVEELLAGRFPLWNPYSFLGVPFFADPQSAVLYPLNLIYVVWPNYLGVTLDLLIHTIMAAVFMFICARKAFGLGRFGSLLAATAFAFSGYFAVHMIHLNYIDSGVWLPLIICLFHLCLQTGKIIYIPATAAAIALQLLAGGSQLAYYTWLALILYLVSTISIKQYKLFLSRVITLSIILALGFGLTAVQTLPTIELTSQSFREGGLAYEQTTWWSIEPVQLLFLTFFPTFLGGGIAQAGQSVITESANYLGLLPLFLSGVAVAFTRNRRLLVFLLILTAASLLFALGSFNPSHRLAVDWLPGFKFFRAHGRLLLLYSFAVSIMAGVGLEILGSALDQFLRKRILTVCRLVAVGIGVISLVFSAAGWLLPKGSIIAERVSISQPSIYQPLGFAIASLILVSLLVAKPFHARKLQLAMILFVAVDLFAFSRATAYSAPKGPPDSSFTEAFVGDLSSYRVAKPPAWYSNLLLPQEIAEVGGYTGAILPLKRYENLLATVGSNPEAMLRLLNVKYLIDLPTSPPNLVIFENPAEIGVKLLPNPLPRAFLIYNAEISEPSAILSKMARPDFDPSALILLESGEPLDVSSHEQSGSAKVLSYDPQRVAVETDSAEAGYLLLTDAYYPGWQADVDGAPEPILRADYYFRAVKISSGRHSVVFSYQPSSFTAGIAISLLTLLACLGIAIIYLIGQREKQIQG